MYVFFFLLVQYYAPIHFIFVRYLLLRIYSKKTIKCIVNREKWSNLLIVAKLMESIVEAEENRENYICTYVIEVYTYCISFTNE